MSTPRHSVISDDSDISRKENYFTSHINTIVSCSCGLVVTPMVVLNFFSESDEASLNIVTCDVHVV